MRPCLSAGHAPRAPLAQLRAPRAPAGRLVRSCHAPRASARAPVCDSAAPLMPLRTHAVPRPRCAAPRTYKPLRLLRTRALPPRPYRVPSAPGYAPAAPSAASCLALQLKYNFYTAIQFLSLTQLPQSRYKNCIVTHCLPSLQYNTCIAIHSLPSLPPLAIQ